MIRRILTAGTILLSFAAAARAQEKFTFHEGLQAGDRIVGGLTVESNYKGIIISNGKTTNQDSHYKQVLNSVENVVAVKDGSATEAKVDVSADSYDIEKEAGQDEKKTPCSLAGQSVTLRRRNDEKIITDLKGDVDPTDLQNVEGCIVPDADYFPDHAVAVGESWDATRKIASHSDLGKDDKLLAQCRLDWVKEIEGRKMAQITCVSGTIRHDESGVEEDIESTATCLVDMAAGQIVKADQTGTSKQFTPKDSAVQVNVVGDYKFHGEAQTNTHSKNAATQP